MKCWYNSIIQYLSSCHVFRAILFSSYEQMIQFARKLSESKRVESLPVSDKNIS